MTNSGGEQHARAAMIAEIERLGFKWHEEAQYDLTQLSRDRRVQVRESKNVAPKDNVAQYAAQMDEVVFPPILVTADGYTVDGNTRYEARMLRKDKFSPAIILDLNYVGNTEKVKAEIRALAATLNQKGAQRLNAAEVRALVRDFALLNWKPEQIARAVGATGQTVAQVKRELAAEEKLTRVGLKTDDIKGASLRALGAEKVVSLNDVPFKELASLAADAGFNAAEISDTAKQMRSLAADDKAIEHVKGLRKEMGARIREHALTGAGRPPVSRQLRQHLGFINKFETSVSNLLESSPQNQQQTIEALEKAMKVLGDLLTKQREVAAATDTTTAQAAE